MTATSRNVMVHERQGSTWLVQPPEIWTERLKWCLERHIHHWLYVIILLFHSTVQSTDSHSVWSLTGYLTFHCNGLLAAQPCGGNNKEVFNTADAVVAPSHNTSMSVCGRLYHFGMRLDCWINLLSYTEVVLRFTMLFWSLLSCLFPQQLRVCCNPSTIDHTGYAMETTKRALQFYENYFNIPFPLPKIGMSSLDQ